MRGWGEGVCELIVKLIEKDDVHTESWTVIKVFITMTCPTNHH